MARVTYVKKAQQRYATVPVIDPETGQQKRVPVMNPRTGQQKTTKRGALVWRKVTEEDRSQPLPLRKCEACGKDLEVGQPYKHVTPKSGPYGGRTRFRCATCPTWQPWDLSQSLSARLAQIDHNWQQALGAATNEDDVKAALEDAATAVRELAEEKRESAENMESGFGHATYQSEELAEQADSLESWADDIEQADVPALADYPCENCNGEGEVECEDCDGAGCETCEGNGVMDCDQCDEDHADPDAWREAVESEVTVMEECPL